MVPEETRLLREGVRKHALSQLPADLCLLLSGVGFSQFVPKDLVYPRAAAVASGRY